MPSELKVGLIGEASQNVTEEDTAARWGSGLVHAFSTPALIALTEIASVRAIEKFLGVNEASVGVEVSMKHIAATPIGMVVKARAELVEIDERRLKFKIEAWDEKDKVCEGELFRAIVDRSRFINRLTQKAG